MLNEEVLGLKKFNGKELNIWDDNNNYILANTDIKLNEGNIVIEGNKYNDNDKLEKNKMDYVININKINSIIRNAVDGSIFIKTNDDQILLFDEWVA